VEGVGGDGGDIVAMTDHRLSAATIRQIEFDLEKAERGMAMPYDAERVMQLRSMLREARKQKLSAGLRARREKGRG
jgi:hypothetical protein